MVSASNSSDYSAKSIKVLEGLEPVRKRPAMYIGSTSIDGVYHCLSEIVDNGIDEALAGFAHQILIVLGKDGYITVIDDGRGIPVDKVAKYNVSALELVMTKLHAGGKFDGKTYKISGGLHGVGASVVNALSEHLIVEVKKKEGIYRQEYKSGAPLNKVKIISNTLIDSHFKSGVSISFLPDKTIFKESIELALKQVKKQIKERAYLIPKVTFTIEDHRTNETYAYYFDGGILSLMRDLNKNRKTIHDPIYIKKDVDDKEIEVAIQYNDSISETVLSFVNVINTHE